MHLLLMIYEQEAFGGLHDYFPWENYGIDEILTTTTIREAQHLIKNFSFDVIIYDINFPNQANFQFIQQVQQIHHPPFIIMLSHTRDFEAIQQAIALGVKRYIVKDRIRFELPTALQQLKSLHLSTSNPTLQTAPIHTNETLQLIIQYIDARYPHISLHDVAAAFRMNPTYLSTFFKTHMNKSFSSYITHKRLEHASSLLQTSTYKTYEISQLIGYRNAKHFSQKFRHYYGITPNQFRRQQALINASKTE